MAMVPSLKSISTLASSHVLLDFVEETRPEFTEYLLTLLEDGVFSAVTEDLLIILLQFYSEKVTDRILKAVVPCHLRELKVDKCLPQLTFFGLTEVIKKCPHLQKISLKECDQLMSPGQFVLWRRLGVSITALCLESCHNVSDQVVKSALRHIPTLQHLNVSSCDSLTETVFLLNEELQKEREFTPSHDTSHHYECSLISVDVSGCRGITATAVRHLTSLTGPTLKNVNLSWTSINLIAILSLAGYSLPAMIELVLSFYNKAEGPKDPKNDELYKCLLEFKTTLEKVDQQQEKKETDHVTSGGKDASEADGATDIRSVMQLLVNMNIATDLDEEVALSTREYESIGLAGIETCSMEDRSTEYKNPENTSNDLYKTVGNSLISSEAQDLLDPNIQNIKESCFSNQESTDSSAKDLTNQLEFSEASYCVHPDNVEIDFVEAPEDLVPDSTNFSKTKVIDICSTNNESVNNVDACCHGCCGIGIHDGANFQCQTDDACVPNSNMFMKTGSEEDLGATSINFDQSKSIKESTCIDMLSNKTDSIHHSDLNSNETVFQLSEHNNAKYRTGNDLICQKCEQLRLACDSSSVLCNGQLAKSESEGNICDHKNCTVDGKVEGQIYNHANGKVGVDNQAIAFSDCVENLTLNNDCTLKSCDIDVHDANDTCLQNIKENDNIDDKDSKPSDENAKMKGEENIDDKGIKLSDDNLNFKQNKNVDDKDRKLLDDNLKFKENGDVEEDSRNSEENQTDKSNTPKVNREIIKQTYKPQLVSVDVTNKFTSVYESVGFDCLKEFLQCSPSLQKFGMSWAGLTDEMVKDLTPFLKDLKEISLTDCESVTYGISHIGQTCQKLKKVDFNGIHFIKDLFLRPFLLGPELQNLYLAESDISDGTLFRLAARKMDKFEELDLSWCDEVTVQGLNALCRKPSPLKKLSFRHCPASTMTLALMAENFKQLQNLNICSVDSITDASMVYLAENLPLLQEIDASWNSGLSDVSVKALLRSCIYLKKAVLSGIKFLTSAPYLPIISDLQKFRRCQALLRFKLQERKMLTENGEEHYSSDEEYEELCVPYRSTTYAANLQILELEYCDCVDDNHLAEIVAVCRGSLHIVDYFSEAIKPVMIHAQKGKICLPPHFKNS
ncbi:unnamed protein product [Mytilus edulis]|uniref:F-box/LRR-repeat protein 15-like leucin rich repeat domain-containing protein n=1 Tax=Mytilus edulis TaxID=6550 RepID=A0A8S3PQP0_MYTED|nr:unnamed protein product [Mytilus edulis]